MDLNGGLKHMLARGIIISLTALGGEKGYQGFF